MGYVGVFVAVDSVWISVIVVIVVIVMIVVIVVIVVTVVIMVVIVVPVLQGPPLLFDLPHVLLRQPCSQPSFLLKFPFHYRFIILLLIIILMEYVRDDACQM